MARKGNVNLLPVQAKRSRDPGDYNAMVSARQRFLNGCHYQPFAEPVNRLIFTHAARRNAILSCLDAGCGEGYYLRSLAAANSDQSLALAGVDISKWAVRAAAGQEKRLTWIVGSNANLPGKGTAETTRT